MDRRDFLKLASVLTCAAAVGSVATCTVCGRAPDDHLPFDVWAEVRDALRTSPDHLVARAAQLVADADAAKLFEFVRDQIATYPGDLLRLDPMRGMRWGTRGTLRGGAGTPREKAELLAELYRRAGWKAEVMQAPITLSEEAAKKLLWRSPDLRFAPAVDEDQLEEWRSRLGFTTNDVSKVPRIDEEGTESRELARTLEAALPAERRNVRPFDWRWGGATPVVRVETGHGSGDSDEASGRSAPASQGSARNLYFANLFTPGVAFGEAGVEPNRLRPAAAADELPEVEVTLSAAMSESPDERIDLVSGKWPLADLVGRQVVVQMLPGLDLRQLAVATFRDVQTFVPALAVQGFDLEREAMETLSVVGDPISRDGDRIEISAEGALSVNGRTITGAGSSPSAVARLQMEVDSSQYPNIRLTARATDARGAPVEGLLASDFAISEDGRPVGFRLRANRAAPRVLFLSDASGSMPSEYRGDGMVKLVEDLTARIKAEHPHASVRAKATSSELWKWLAWGAESDANLIIFATDGHSEGELTNELRAVITAGPPLVIVNVRGYDEENHWYRQTLAPMAEVSNGTVVSATEPAEAQAAILAYLREAAPELPPYQFTYGAPTDEAGERRVTLAMAKVPATVTGRYVAPGSSSITADFCGLYLTVSIGNEETTRTLAGYDPVQHAEMAVSDAMRNEALGACFGTHYLSFEAAAPSLSVWLDDFLTAKLSIASLDEALDEKRDLETLDHIVQEGFTTLPAELYLQTIPIGREPATRALTWETGPRSMMYGAYPVFGANHVIRHVDFLPFTSFATASDDAAESFRITMEKTARIAVAEASLYPMSTKSLLREARLVSHSALQRNRSLSPDLLAMWRKRVRQVPSGGYQLVPAGGAPLALWNVDGQTGTVLGFLPDGSGGGSAEERIMRQLAEIDRVMGAYNLLLGRAASVAGVPMAGGVALGVVAAYGQLLTRLYGAASLAIAIMDAGGIEQTVRAALQQFACNVMKTIFTAPFGKLGEAFSGLEYLVSLLGGDEHNPFAC